MSEHGAVRGSAATGLLRVAAAVVDFVSLGFVGREEEEESRRKEGR